MNHSEQSIRLTRADGVPAEQVALQWQFYQGKVAGPVARFTLEQQFSNQGHEPLELLYTFPLNSDMVITGFRLLINGRLVEGEVKPLEEVQEAFDRAVLEGNTASFLHQHRSNVFTLNVGNLAPRDELRVQLRLIQWLELKGGQLRLMLPTVVGPRYIPGRPTGAGTGFGWAEPTDQVPDADWITPPVSPEGVPYRTSFHIEIAETLPVRSVESPSHRIRVERQGEATVIRSATNSRSNRDVVVTVELAALLEGRAWSTALEEGHLVSFWLKGPADPSGSRPPLDVVFLIDVSGSMAYQKLEVVKQAVRLCLRKLSSRDRFNLMAFSSDFEVWRGEWQAMGEASLAAAERWLIGQEAHGGTELLPALQSALKQPLDPERQPLLVLLTDGQVGNEAAIAAEFAERGRGWRVLLFGIDTAVNQELFQQITQVCSGLVEYIYPGEPLEHKVNLQFERVGLPLVDSLKLVDGENRLLRRFPEEAVPLHETDCRPCLLLLDGPSPSRVRLRLDTISGRRQDVALQVEPLEEEGGRALVKLYADRLIRHYERRYDAARWQHNLRHAERLKKEIVTLGLTHQLQTRFTAWYAEYQREEKVDALPRIQVIPVELPESWQADRVFAPMRMLHADMPHFDRVFKRQILNEPARSPALREARVSESRTLVVEALLSQEADGRIVPEGLDGLPPTAATLIALIGILLAAGEEGIELSAYRSNIQRAIEFATGQADFAEPRHQQLAGCLALLLAEAGLPDFGLTPLMGKKTRHRRLLSALAELVRGRPADFWTQLHALLNEQLARRLKA